MSFCIALHRLAELLVYISTKATLSPALHLISIKLTNRFGFIAKGFAVNIFEAMLKAHSTYPNDAGTLTGSLPISLCIGKCRSHEI